MEQQKLNVLVGIDVYLPDTDGVINCMKNYCLNCCDNVNLTVIAPNNKRGYKDNLPYKIFRCNSMYVPFLNQYYGFPTTDADFMKQVRSQKYDIVHIHSPFNMGKFAYKIAKEQNIPIVATFHTNFRLIFQNLLGNAVSEGMVKNLGKFYNKLDEIFVCSKNIEEQARSFGCKNKISLLPFGTELEKVDDVEPLKVQANELYGLNENDFLFIFVGRVMPLKRVDFILKALKKVKERGYNFKFFVVGKGPETTKLKNLTKKLELEEEVRFLGFVKREHFPLVNARADLLLFPSIYDNFGLVKVEAAAYKTAGLFIEGSNAGDGIIDGENGFLSANDLDAFVEKIVYCIEHKQELNEIGQNAQNTLYLHWKDATTCLLDKYSEIVESWEGRPTKSQLNEQKKMERIHKKQVIKRAKRINSAKRM